MFSNIYITMSVSIQFILVFLIIATYSILRFKYNAEYAFANGWFIVTVVVGCFIELLVFFAQLFNSSHMQELFFLTPVYMCSLFLTIATFDKINFSKYFLFSFFAVIYFIGRIINVNLDNPEQANIYELTFYWTVYSVILFRSLYVVMRSTKTHFKNEPNIYIVLGLLVYCIVGSFLILAKINFAVGFYFRQVTTIISYIFYIVAIIIHFNKRKKWAMRISI